MSTDITGLFGLSPEEIQQQNAQSLQANAYKYAQLTPMQQATAGIYQGAGMLGQAGASALGMSSPQEQMSRQTAAATKGLDLNSPESLRELSKRLLSVGNQRGAAIAAQKANDLEKEQAATNLTKAHTDWYKSGGKPAPAISYNSEIGVVTFDPNSQTYSDADGNQLTAAQLGKLTLTKIVGVGTGGDGRHAGQTYSSKYGTVTWNPDTKKWSLASGAPLTEDQLVDFNPKRLGAADKELPKLDKSTIDFYAEQSLNGDNSWQTGLARGAVGQQLIAAVKDRIPQMAAERGITVPGVISAKQDVQTRGAALKAFAVGKEAQTTRTLNTSIDHLNTLSDLSSQLDNSNLQTWNRVTNYLAAITGQSAPTSFEAAKHIVAGEVEKALTAGQTSQKGRDQASAMFDRANSPEQLAEAVKVAQELLAGQMRSLEQQFINGTGRPASEFRAKLTPKTLSVMGVTYNMPQVSAPSNAAPMPTGAPQNTPVAPMPSGKITPAQQSGIEDIKTSIQQLEATLGDVVPGSKMYTRIQGDIEQAKRELSRTGNLGNDDFNKRWAALPKGQSMTGPDGKTYRKK